MAKLGSFSSIHQPADRVLRRRINLSLAFVPYSFTAWTFTNGNSSGNTGPTTSNLRALYNTTGNTWINNDAYFSATGGIQYWTVPASGVYTITVAGASGGGNVGYGAVATGTVSLTAGETVRILVGQMGQLFSSFYSSGGGGTFVMRTPFNSNASIVAIAGGGGGFYTGGGTANSGGTTTTTPGGGAGVAVATGGGGGGGSLAAGGLNGAVGSNTGGNGYSGGGGGLFGNGGDGILTTGGRGGKSFTNGGIGGAGEGPGNLPGGFGGGGGTGGRGGGGGGYNGGGSSPNNSLSGMGGSSYLLNGVFTATANSNLGHGYVTIVSGGSALGNITGTNTATTSGATVGTTNGSPFSTSVNSYTIASQPGIAPYNYISVPGGSGYAFGQDDYTIEWFQYMTASSINQRAFWYGTGPTLGVSMEGSDSAKVVYVWNGSANSQGTIALTANTWQHMALVRRSGRTYFYFNGNVINPSGAVNVANLTDTSSVMYFGSKAGAGLQNEQFVGSMTNIRIVKGLAVYTGNFTVPTSALAQTQVANPYGGANTAAISFGYTTLLLNP